MSGAVTVTVLLAAVVSVLCELQPRDCRGPTCRMLCPHGFAVDPTDGCPVCECRDPCAGVRCPDLQQCRVQASACAQPPCPAVARCVRGRSLRPPCSYGVPLAIEGTHRPFLCGPRPGHPSCPPTFTCTVADGQEYGVCCHSSLPLTKPGSCPADALEGGCGLPCDHDMSCPSMLKCCPSQVCGSHCVQPFNVTACLQQRMVAELVAVKERAGKGYVPQCSALDGRFLPRQCSRNGLVCWCVDSAGTKVAGTMGAADSVPACAPHGGGRALDQAPPPTCDRNICAHVCEYGFHVSSDGCPTCECDDPCNAIRCPDGEECVAVKDDDCDDGILCPSSPLCRAKVTYVKPCRHGTPLEDPETFEVVQCREGGNGGCPDTHECTQYAPSVRPVCCPRAADGLPEVRCPSILVRDVGCGNMTSCLEDSGCAAGARCCPAGTCGRVCVDRETSAPQPVHPQTMCEFLRDVGERLDDGVHLAIPVPSCTADGYFNATQCDAGTGTCWCVDDFGTEIPGTRHTEGTDCAAVRADHPCLAMTCRLGCDYGFTLDATSGCPRCECRDPCSDGASCGDADECRMLEVECEDGTCPPVPACVRQRPGQCPYLVPLTAGTCEYRCRYDHECNGTTRCCSNGCGTECVPPVMMTACQHERSLLLHRAHEAGIPASRMFIPQCREGDGGYRRVQCNPATRSCWCVDDRGHELPGTRSHPDVEPSCEEPRECPGLECAPCQHGYSLDPSGCPTCECRDPCRDVPCRGEGETCRLVDVACVEGGGPCPPVPMCLPRRDNPCVTGRPLDVPGTSESLRCGPAGAACPSSHKCQLSPLGEYAVCCPKPREVCFEPAEPGQCQPPPHAPQPTTRWWFNPRTNRCDTLNYTGCGGNMNNFESLHVCNAVCPLLSQCERLRERNQQVSLTYQKATFMPRCDPRTGHWQAVQCLHPVGVCWCVTQQGQPLKGSLTRGQPQCGTSRGGRKTPTPHSDEELSALITELLQEVAMLVQADTGIPAADTSIPAADTTWTRCRALQEQLRHVGATYAVACDAEGRFEPLQCYPSVPECWCVDEAGNQLANTTTFEKGTRTCLATPIKAVDVVLGFHSSRTGVQTKTPCERLRALLATLQAKLKDGTIDGKVTADGVRCTFTLIGDDKVDVAYRLEEMVKAQRVKLQMDAGTVVTADLTRSRFSNRLQGVGGAQALGRREVVSPAVSPYQTATVVLTTGSAFIICVLLLLLALYRRRLVAGTKAGALHQPLADHPPPVYVVSVLPHHAKI